MYKGVVFNVIYNLLFVVSGYLVHFFLGTTMTPSQYGLIGSIITILDFEYLFLNNGVRQSLSKEISKNKYDIKDLKTIMENIEKEESFGFTYKKKPTGQAK